MADCPRGLLAGQLLQLDIPSNARLTSVTRTEDEDGLTTWRVTYAIKNQLQAGATPSLADAAALGQSEAEGAIIRPIQPAMPDAPARQQAGFPHLPQTPGALNRLFPLRCDVKTYAWGRLGHESLVGRLKEAGDSDFDIDAETPYSELWMGTHPSGPSMVMLETPWRTTTPLFDWLKLNPSLQGSRPATDSANRRKSMVQIESHGLSFLFKILSVRTALSIQAHPDKALARKLHSARPDLYKDDNHKPEIAIAISRFEALCSFQKAYSVLENVRSCPELVAVVGEGSIGALASAAELPADDIARKPGVKVALRELFTALMNADTQRVEEQCENLATRIKSTSPMLRTPVDELATRIFEQYPKDVGVFCVYLFNYLELQPGEALYLGANEPHAYLSGECAECMATSDNVVRAGCTSKFKDVTTLVTMLTYSDGAPHIVKPIELDANSLRYSDYPSTEFMIDRCALSNGAVGALPSAPGVSILIVVQGEGTLEEMPENTAGAAGLMHTVAQGNVFMVCSGTFLRLRARGGEMLAFRACAKYELE